MRASQGFVVKVQSHSRWRRIIIGVFLAVCLIVGGWSLYDYGRYTAGYDSAAAAEARLRMMEYINELEAENQRLQQRVALLQQGSEVDRHAFKDVSQSLKSLQDEVYELKEEVAFYRGVLESGDTDKGLQIQSLMLENGGQRHEYRFKLVLTQVMADTRVIQGDVEMTVYGMKDGAEQALPLSKLTRNGVGDLHFRFKYFQKLQGRITFPKGFMPTRVALRVVPKGRSRASLEKTFVWNEITA